MKILNTILSVIIILLYSYLSYLLYDIGLLSGILEKVLMIVLFVVMILIILGMFKLKNKKKIIAYVFYVILLIVLSVGIYYLNPTKNFIDSFDTADKTSYDNYYVVVLKKSKYTKLSDLKDKPIGVCEDLSKKVTKKININYEEQKLDSCARLKENLFDGMIDAAILSDVSEYLISSSYEDF